MDNYFLLTSAPNQTYTLTVSGAKRNITFILTQAYNAQAGYWVLGIYDKTNSPIILNIPLFCGYDLLEQYGYLGIGSLYLENIGDQAIEYPNDKNIDGNFELKWVLE